MKPLFTTQKSIINAVKGQITWLRLKQIGNSFLSKVVTAFSVALIAISNILDKIQIHSLEWRAFSAFFGALSFFLAYCIATIRMPSEFKVADSLHEIADKMNKLAFPDFIESRREMAKNMADRLNKATPWDMEKELLRKLNDKVYNKEEKPGDNIGFYFSDLVVRQYDRPNTRLTVFVLYMIGVILLLIPTVITTLKILFGLGVRAFGLTSH